MVMDALVLAEYLLKDIRQRKQDFADSLVNGSIDSIENYRFTVGQVRGMTYVEELIKAAMKGIELEND
tara:strand:+ start:927 stop:1130 length:204 start_codon:yes stop_codon:yes gene_type:complete